MTLAYASFPSHDHTTHCPMVTSKFVVGQCLIVIVWALIVKLGLNSVPQWGAADAEIKVPFGENTELERSPFKAWSR